jgi:polar amino acid transport system substrate-binding protein
VAWRASAPTTVPLNQPQSLAFAKKFMTEALSNGVMRKAYDNNGLKDLPISKQ